jgi:GNAT superfamily N-acetyltransferase
MSSPLPDGISVRPLRAEDAAAVAGIITESDENVGGTPQIAADDVKTWWLRTKLEEDSWFLDDSGDAVAVGWLDSLNDHAFAFACVRPGAMGRGLGSWLLNTTEQRARDLGLQLLRHGTNAADATARSLFEGAGYREARRHYEMAIELDREPPHPVLPDRLAIETFRTEDARAFHAASTESFEDEWGHSPMEFDAWWEMRSNDPQFDPSLWFLVRDGDEIAAIARCEGGRHGGGFVGLLGVRKPWRRRGLGQALLLHAFREFHDRGYERASLGVDSENPTGATRLYESVGMHVESVFVTFEKTLA